MHLRGRESAVDVARLKANLAADADELAAMLVRVADTERAREAATLRATALEKWSEELEAKVAAARTRADDLEAELARVRREHQDALDVGPLKRVKEPDAFAPDPHAVMTKLLSTLEQLERHEADAAGLRHDALQDLRRILGTPTAPPPDASAVSTLPPVPSTPPPQPLLAKPAAPTTAHPVKPAAKRSRRMSAQSGPPAVRAQPPAPPVAPGAPAQAAGARSVELVTFEDIDLSD